MSGSASWLGYQHSISTMGVFPNQNTYRPQSQAGSPTTTRAWFSLSCHVYIKNQGPRKHHCPSPEIEELQVVPFEGTKYFVSNTAGIMFSANTTVSCEILEESRYDTVEDMIKHAIHITFCFCLLYWPIPLLYSTFPCSLTVYVTVITIQ